MKKNYPLAFLILISVSLSCDKEEESIVDCFGQSLFIDLHHSVSENNSRQVSFNATYSGDHTMDNAIKWNFGDNNPVQTVSGATTSHTYANAGTYTATGTVTLNNGSCSYDLHETVTVE